MAVIGRNNCLTDFKEIKTRVNRNTLKTIEVRWFETGELPAEVETWFDRHCLPNPSGIKETREDFYLYLPESTTVSYKWRQGNLELKWRQAELETQQFGNVWWGKLERWHKWIERELVPQNQLEDLFPAKFWIGVSKQRRQRSQLGISGELTTIKIQARLWWSLAFEMTDGSCDRLTRVLDRISQTYTGPKLSIGSCFAYPQLLAAIANGSCQIRS